MRELYACLLATIAVVPRLLESSSSYYGELPPTTILVLDRYSVTASTTLASLLALLSIYPWLYLSTLSTDSIYWSQLRFSLILRTQIGDRYDNIPYTYILLLPLFSTSIS